jgi:uncharacterized protein (DUF58 family)
LVTVLPPDGDGIAPVDELLRRLRWPVIRRLAVHPGGDEPSRLRGAGVEYADVREYQPGDDPRSIDWNLTARSDRTYVRESVPDRGVDVWLLIDTSRSLDWGTARCLKRQLALELAAAAGQLLVRHGNRIGALLFDQRVEAVIRPAAGRTGLMRLVANIDQASTPLPATGQTDLAGVLLEAGRLLRRPSLVILISDFMVPDGWEAALGALTLRHEVVAAVISDPREREIPDVGMVTFEDPETGRQLRVDTRSKRLRERFRQAAEEQRLALSRKLVQAGAGVAELSTEHDLVPQLLEFFLRRRAERRSPQGPRPA